MRTLFKFILASSALTLIGANLLLAEVPIPDPPTNPSAQTTCPVMGGQIGPVDKALYVDAKGKRIYICCAACESAIRTDPDLYIKKIEKRGETVADAPNPEDTAADANKKGP